MSMIDVDDYRAKLAHLIDLQPDHHMLEILRDGEDEVNMIILDDIIKTLPPPIKIVDDIPKDLSTDLQMMYAQLNTQFNKEHQMSNKFHECRSDKERAKVSMDIRPIRAKIKDILLNIEFYEKHKEMPQEIDAEKFPIPADPWELNKLLLKTRTKISQHKAKIKNLMGIKAPEVIQKYEKKLAELKLYKLYIERAKSVQSTKSS